MTAGPTPVPPAVSQAMAAPMLYHRAPAFVELYERVLGKLPYVFQTENPVLAFAASGSGAMESAAANLVRPGVPVLACAAGKFGERWIELGDAYGDQTRALRAGLGRAPRPGRDRPPADRERRHRGRLRHAQRDLDRHRPRRRRDRRGRPRARRDPRRRRRLGPRRRRAAPGRVGHRRRRGRLAEGAHVPARPRASPRSPSARSSTPPASRAAATTSTGARAPRPRRKGNSAFTPAVTLFLGLDVALDMIREEGLEDVLRPPRAAGPRHARRRRRARPRALRRRRRALDRRHRRRAAGLDRRRQGPRRAAQARDHRQRRPGPAQGPHPADRPLRLLRRLRHPDLAVGPRDGALPARPRGRARRRRRRRPARLRRGRRRRAARSDP